jgi:hypothetical protein
MWCVFYKKEGAFNLLLWNGTEHIHFSALPLCWTVTARFYIPKHRQYATSLCHWRKVTSSLKMNLADKSFSILASISLQNLNCMARSSGFRAWTSWNLYIFVGKCLHRSWRWLFVVGATHNLPCASISVGCIGSKPKHDQQTHQTQDYYDSYLCEYNLSAQGPLACANGQWTGWLYEIVCQVYVAELLLTPLPKVKYTNTSLLGLCFSQPVARSSSIMQQQSPRYLKQNLFLCGLMWVYSYKYMEFVLCIILKILSSFFLTLYCQLTLISKQRVNMDEGEWKYLWQVINAF